MQRPALPPRGKPSSAPPHREQVTLSRRAAPPRLIGRTLDRCPSRKLGKEQRSCSAPVGRHNSVGHENGPVFLRQQLRLAIAPANDVRGLSGGELLSVLVAKHCEGKFD